MNKAGTIDVMVVEDSLVARELLVHILSSDPALRVIACASSGEEAISVLAEKNPHVVTMDIVVVKPTAEIKLVAIGASTGGPVVLQTILSRLPKPPPVPVVIVQHITAGFVQGLADWLGVATGIPVKVAADGDILHPGRVYIA